MGSLCRQVKKEGRIKAGPRFLLLMEVLVKTVVSGSGEVEAENDSFTGRAGGCGQHMEMCKGTGGSGAEGKARS